MEANILVHLGQVYFFDTDFSLRLRHLKLHLDFLDKIGQVQASRTNHRDFLLRQLLCFGRGALQCPSILEYYLCPLLLLLLFRRSRRVRALALALRLLPQVDAVWHDRVLCLQAH